MILLGINRQSIFKLLLGSMMIISPMMINGQTPELTEDKILINNISVPWGFTFINSDEVIFTERQGKLYRYVISTNSKTEISGVPAVSQNGQGGLLDIALHPEFASNRFVYLTYAVFASGGQTTALGRGKLVDDKLTDFKEIFRALPIVNSGVHFGSRIVFDNNKKIYMSVGDRGTPEHAQNRNNHLGKVLRLNDDGTAPNDNPLIDTPNTKPEIYCWGNRNIQGMAMHPVTGEIYAHEHGPRGGDELNLIKPNTNYGWPLVTFGINYNGTTITPDTTLPGMTLPLTYWVPSIAPSGMSFLRNAQQANEADILIGALAGTHIHWLKLKDNKKLASYRSMNGYARFRDVRQAPDGQIYALTESPNRFIRLKSNVRVFTSSVTNHNLVAVDNLNVYPNPLETGSTISFRLYQNQNISLRILDNKGLVIKENKVRLYTKGTHTIQLDADNISPGLYFVEVNTGNGRIFHRVVKL